MPLRLAALPTVKSAAHPAGLGLSDEIDKTPYRRLPRRRDKPWQFHPQWLRQDWSCRCTPDLRLHWPVKLRCRQTLWVGRRHRAQSRQQRVRRGTVNRRSLHAHAGGCAGRDSRAPKERGQFPCRWHPHWRAKCGEDYERLRGCALVGLARGPHAHDRSSFPTPAIPLPAPGLPPPACVPQARRPGHRQPE